MPMVPFVTEMEEDLAASESRIRLLSDQFANEQKRASEVVEALSQELELAQARNKRLDQLSRRELELTSKDRGGHFTGPAKEGSRRRTRSGQGHRWSITGPKPSIGGHQGNSVLSNPNERSSGGLFKR